MSNKCTKMEFVSEIVASDGLSALLVLERNLNVCQGAILLHICDPTTMKVIDRE